MTRGRRTWGFATGLVVAVIATFALVATLVSPSQTEVGQGGQQPADDVPVAVVPSTGAGGVTDPVGLTVTLEPLVSTDAVATVGIEISFLVRAVGVRDLASVELWIDGTLNGPAVDLSADERSDWTGLMSWTPTSPGAGTAVARVSDTAGRETLSNVVDLAVTPTATTYTVDESAAPGGATWQAVADAASVEVDIFAPPGIDPLTTGPEPGALVPVVEPLDLGDQSRRGQSAPPTTTDSTSLITADDGADPCHRSIAYRSAQDGFGELSLTAVAPGGLLFAKTTQEPVIDGSVATFNVALRPGKNTFAVTETFEGDITTTPPVHVLGAENCGAEWSGPLRIDTGMLRGVPDDVDRAYFFIGNDAGEWTRVPEPDQSAVGRVGDAFPVAEYLPDLTETSTATIEVWGWSPEGLRNLGRSTLTPGNGFDLTSLVDSTKRAQLWYGNSPPTPVLAVDDLGEHEFSWNSTIPHTTHGIWQILETRPAENASPLHDAVLRQGIIEGSHGSFTLDLSGLLDAPTAADLLPFTTDYFDVSAFAANPETRLDNPSSDPFSEIRTALTDVDAPDLFRRSQLYLRVVPMVGERWPGVASNTIVTLEQPEPQRESTVDFPAVEFEAEISEPSPPNLFYTQCVEFIGWDDTILADPEKAPTSLERATWESNLELLGGRPICGNRCYNLGPVTLGLTPEACRGDIPILGPALRSLIAVWDGLVHAFREIKATVIELAVTLSGCRHLSDAAGTDPAFCDAAAAIVVNGALAAAGIPPDLPDSSQLNALARAEVGSLVATIAQTYGVPCDEFGAAATVAGADELSCEALVGAMYDAVVSQIDDMVRLQARSTTGVNLPAGMIVRPHPQGQIGAPVLSVTVQPTSEWAGVTSSEPCVALINVTASWISTDPIFDPARPAIPLPDGSPGIGLTNLSWLPGGFSTGRYLVPWRIYDGPVSLQRIELPTAGLVYDERLDPEDQATVSQMYVLDTVEHEPVDAYRSTPHSGPYAFGTVPYESLQLQTGASGSAELVAACTGLHAVDFEVSGAGFRHILEPAG